MWVLLSTSLPWVSSGKREETSVFSKSQRDVKSSQAQLPWALGMPLLVQCPSLWAQPTTKIFFEALISAQHSWCFCHPSNIFLWKLKLIFNYAPMLLHNVYLIIVNSSNIITIYYLLNSYYILLLKNMH